MAKKVRWIPHDQALKLVQEGRLKLKLDSGIARQIARSPRYARDCGPHYRRVWWRSLLQIPVYVLLFFVYLYFNGQGRPLDFFLLMLALWLMDLLFTRPSKQNKPEEEEPIVREALEERGLYELIASLGAWEYKPSSIIEEISREAAAASEDLPAVEFDLGLETAKKQKSYEEALKCYGKKPKKIKAAEFLHKLILNSPHYPEKRRRLWNLESGFFTVLMCLGFLLMLLAVGRSVWSGFPALPYFQPGVWFLLGLALMGLAVLFSSHLDYHLQVDISEQALKNQKLYEAIVAVGGWKY